jgi:hypothetical protein
MHSNSTRPGASGTMNSRGAQTNAAFSANGSIMSQKLEIASAILLQVMAGGNGQYPISRPGGPSISLLEGYIDPWLPKTCTGVRDRTRTSEQLNIPGFWFGPMLEVNSNLRV